MIGIYSFRNKYNQKRYIGKSINIEKRRIRHIKNAYCGKQKSYFYTALRKWGEDSFDFEVLIECPKENLDYWERFYIKYYCSNLPQHGYNMTIGGTGGFTGLNSGNWKKGNVPWCTGLTKYDDPRLAMSDEGKIHISEGGKKYYAEHPERAEHIRQELTGRYRYHLGDHCVCIKPELIPIYKSMGYTPGMGKPSPRKGKKLYIDENGKRHYK